MNLWVVTRESRLFESWVVVAICKSQVVNHESYLFYFGVKANLTIEAHDLWLFVSIFGTNFFCKKNHYPLNLSLQFLYKHQTDGKQRLFSSEGSEYCQRDPEAAFHLGRLLFYDPGISSDNASLFFMSSSGQCICHGDHRLSHGIRGNIVTPNAPGLFNLSLQPMLMWDGAATSLEDQMLIQSTSQRKWTVISEGYWSTPRGHSLYINLLNKHLVQNLIVSIPFMPLRPFNLRLISHHNRYDGIMEGLTHWTSQEKNGLAIFKEHCQRCHEPPDSDYSFSW